MPEDDSDEWKLSDRPCPHCKVVGKCYYRVCESSCGGYDDEQNECRACGKVWWIESSDA